MIRTLCALFTVLAAARAGEAVLPDLHHEVAVRLDPASHALEVTDTITFREPPEGEVSFLLHAGLAVRSLEGDEVEGDAPVPLRSYRVRLEEGARTLRLSYSGTIHHPLVAEAQEYARSFSRTPGIVSEEGVVLSGASVWLPRFEDTLISFRLEVDLPEGWDAVSQGERTRHRIADGRRLVAWDCEHPMEEAYLIAGRFTEYDRAAGKVTAQAFLRTPDDNLAAKYLEATAQYLELYRKLIGPYPFAKFALVENFWETGYGMPSFTLLGPRIIRFPFILHSSYPHEILHNWWGNSVYVDWQTGNWCEGLTAYLADHLIREGQGRGVEYRRDTLKKYRSYVRAGKDFPLEEFRSRHSSATEAVGYGKSAMLFHMLRRRLGDETFARGLAAFYRSHRFRSASFTDLAGAFSEVAGEDLTPFFRQWVERTGAPALEMTVERPGDDRLVVTVRQVQEGEPYRLRVPVAITFEGRPEAQVETLWLSGRVHRFEFDVEAPVLRVDLDPWFDVFRRLEREETPPTLGEVFGAEKVTIVVHGADWTEFAESWSRGDEVEVVSADELTELPADRAVWVLGAENPWAKAVVGALPGERLDEEQADFSFVYTVRHPRDPELTVGWIASAVPAALPGLARKLPHYGKYSYLGFTGEEPANVAKGTWPATRSPLVAGAEHARGALSQREPLARLAPVFDPEKMREHVAYLAAEEREGRGAGTKGLFETGDYIAAEFERIGLQPGGDDGAWFQTWTEEGGPDGRTVTLRNVVGLLPGTEEPPVVLGAHYDHLGRGWPDVRSGNEGQIHNGADDNASGVAVLLEVARLLAREHRPRRTIAFVAFDGEEWDRRGSRHYVSKGKAWAMVNLDTVGRLGEQKLMMLGSGTATEWRHIAMGVGYTTGVEARSVDKDPGGSDQVSFHEAGTPAVQLFTGAHEDYHRPTDDIEKIDFDGMVKVATFVRETLVYLSGRDAPLTSTLKGAAASTGPRTGRKVSLGVLPDFAHAGPGILAKDVLKDSPALAAGIEPGDLLLAIDGQALKDLRGLSEALKRCKPGDVVRITLRRGGNERTVEATLKAR